MSELKAAILPVTPLQQNCTLIFDADSLQGAVVDPGGDVRAIRSAIDQLGIIVEKILLTHGHIDHAGGAAALKEALSRERGTDVPIIGPDERDWFLLQDLERQGRAYGVTGARNVSPDRWLTEGETVEAAGRSFDVYHCPGHTPGHVVLVNAAERMALVGDVLFQGSIGRTDFPYGDHEALISAIRTKLFPLGDDVAFICGHGPGSTFGEERRSNPYVGEGR
jgi:glyoxylase-like metal-dependent hydrolase (beta-lactamase superfamily II)